MIIGTRTSIFKFEPTIYTTTVHPEWKVTRITERLVDEDGENNNEKVSHHHREKIRIQGHHHTEECSRR